MKFIDDIPLDIARHAHAGTSFVPGERGAQERADYSSTLERDLAYLKKLAGTDDSKAALLDEEFERYRDGYRTRFVAMLVAKGGCVSTMIAGRSNFNVRRARKASESADKRTNELVQYRTRALKAIRKKLCPTEGPIMTSDSDAADKLRAKIAEAERDRDKMKAVNKAIRANAKKGPEAQFAALIEMGFSETWASKALKPSFDGSIGIPSFAITNATANIRRMKKRLESIEVAKATPDTEEEGDNGVTFEDAPSDNRVRLYFPGKPDADVRRSLKSHGFRWAPSLGCWQAYRNPGSIAFARRLAGLKAA